MLPVYLQLIIAAFPVSGSLIPNQYPLSSDTESSKPDKKDLIHELEKAEIIPTVTDVFIPKLTLSIFWENATAELGNTIKPDKLQSAPSVEFINHISNPKTTNGDEKATQLTLALTDPDAPSRDDPEWSEICHWILTNVSLINPAPLRISQTNQHPPISHHHSSAMQSHAVDLAGAHEIMPYKPPGPPPKTGKHRYVFLALAPKNGTREPLRLSKPGDREHWGFEGERMGVRRWAEENGLEVVGANFIYAQNDEQ